MNQEDGNNSNKITKAESADSSLPAKKSYATPVLTEFGQMNQLTKAGAGLNANDGDTEYGSPQS